MATTIEKTETIGSLVGIIETGAEVAETGIEIETGEGETGETVIRIMTETGEEIVTTGIETGTETGIEVGTMSHTEVEVSSPHRHPCTELPVQRLIIATRVWSLE